MSGSSPDRKSPAFVRAPPPPPPPPRIRPESPQPDVVNSDIDGGSDISSVSDFNDEVDDRLEAVSDNELTDVDNISWNDKNDRQPSKDRQDIDENSKMSGPVLVDLEDIESDEDLPAINLESKSLTSSKNGEDKSDEFVDAGNVPFCRHCHLLFSDVDALNSHNKTEPHCLNLSGFKPSNGSFYCVVCWIGHQTLGDLKAHQDSEAHKQEIEKYRIKEINFKPEIDPESNGPEIPSRKRPQEKSCVENPPTKMSRTYPPPLNDFYGISEKGKIVHDCDDIGDTCIPCNLVFMSSYHLKIHLNSKCHKSVLEGRTPSSGELHPPNKQRTSYCCFICWIGFPRLSDLCRHYDQKNHIQMLKKHGILRLHKDHRTADVKASAFDDVGDAKNISLQDYIVLDEIGESDEEEQHLNGIVADQLDNVSSDEELNNSALHNPLEDVDSDDDLANNYNEENSESLIKNLEPLSEDELSQDWCNSNAGELNKSGLPLNEEPEKSSHALDEKKSAEDESCVNTNDLHEPLSETDLVSETGDSDRYKDELDYEEGPDT